MRDDVPRQSQDAGTLPFDRRMDSCDLMNSYSRATDDGERLIEQAPFGGELEHTEPPSQVP